MKRINFKKKFLENSKDDKRLSYTKQRIVLRISSQKITKAIFCKLKSKYCPWEQKVLVDCQTILFRKKRKLRFGGSRYSEHFFSNIVRNLKIPQKNVDNNLSHCLLRHPTLNIVRKKVISKNYYYVIKKSCIAFQAFILH